MYIPTKTELDELGFKETPQIYCDVFQKGEIKIVRSAMGISLYCGNIQYFPQSTEEIKTLIRLLTPQ